MSDIKQDDPISKLHDRYEQNIIPYETIVKTISMHNSQIYQLENRYHKLQKEYDRLKKQV